MGYFSYQSHMGVGRQWSCHPYRATEPERGSPLPSPLTGRNHEVAISVSRMSKRDKPGGVLKNRRNDTLSALDMHEAHRNSRGLRGLGWVLLLVFANLLAACGGGGGGGDAAPPSASSGTPITSGYPATLAWDPVLTAGIQGYRVYYGSAPGTYEQLPGQGIDVGNSTSYTVNGLGSGTRYYFVVTAYDGTTESPPSNEVFKDMP